MAHTYADALLATAFTLAAATSAGVASIELIGVSFAESLVSVASVDITVAAVVSLAVMLGVAILDSVRWASLTDEQKALVGVTVGLIVVLTAIPDIQSAVADSLILGLAVLGIESGGYWALAQAR
jgi:hypothetical protein